MVSHEVAYSQMVESITLKNTHIYLDNLENGGLEASECDVRINFGGRKGGVLGIRIPECVNHTFW